MPVTETIYNQSIQTHQQSKNTDSKYENMFGNILKLRLNSAGQEEQNKKTKNIHWGIIQRSTATDFRFGLTCWSYCIEGKSRKLSHVEHFDIISDLLKSSGIAIN